MILEITYNDTNVKERVTISKERCVIGRSPKADYQIDLECFSRNHIEIEWNEKDFYITDLNSTNGIYVNGERIPAGEKTLFKNFFPMDIAGKVTIAVFPDETDAPSVQPSSPAPSKRDRGGDQTVTKIHSPLSKSKASPKKKGPAPSQDKFKVVVFLGIIIGLGYYFYLTYGQEAPTETAVETSTSQQNFAPQVKIASDELKSQLTGNSCLEFGELCAEMRLINPQEKIVTTADRIIIFVNTTAQIARLNSTYMNEFSPEEQREYILGSFAFHPKIVSAAKENSFKNIVVAAIDVLDDLVQVKSSMVVDLSQMPVVDQENYDRLFSNLFFAGFHRPYKSAFRPYTKLTTY